MTFLICPACKEGSDYLAQNTLANLTCEKCGIESPYYEFLKATRETLEAKKEERIMVDQVFEKKPGLQVAAKCRLTQYGSLQITIYLPQNYIRKVLKLEALPKEQLPKAEPRREV